MLLSCGPIDNFGASCSTAARVSSAAKLAATYIFIGSIFPGDAVFATAVPPSAWRGAYIPRPAPRRAVRATLLGTLGDMEASQLDLLRTDELDIALRLSYLKHYHGGGARAAGGEAGSTVDDKEARRKEKKKLKDLKVRAMVPPPP